MYGWCREQNQPSSLTLHVLVWLGALRLSLLRLSTVNCTSIRRVLTVPY